MRLGHRSATVCPPAVTMSGTASAFGTTSVNGPGQNTAAAFWAISGHPLASVCAMLSSETCTMSGFVVGRPLTWNICATASGSIASAARPYTVSVGTATSWPLASRSAAAARAAAVAGSGVWTSFGQLILARIGSGGRCTGTGVISLPVADTGNTEHDGIFSRLGNPFFGAFYQDGHTFFTGLTCPRCWNHNG